MDKKMRYRYWMLAIVALVLVIVGLADVVRADPLAADDSAESVTDEMDTVGGHLKITRRQVPDDLDQYTFYLSNVEFYRTNVWSINLDKSLKIGSTEVIPVNFLSGGNGNCVNSYGVLAVRSDKKAYWLAETLPYCDATFAVVGDKLVMSDVVAEGRRAHTEKTIIALDGAITHAR